MTIDAARENRSDVIKVVGHEVSHDYGVENEFLADLAGIAADLNVSASMGANQDKIDTYKVQLGDGKDTVTQTENKDLLEANDKTLIKEYIKNPDSFDMSIQSIRSNNGRYSGSYEAPRHYMFNISQYLVKHHMLEKYPEAFNKETSAEDFANFVLISMEEVGISDSIFEAFKNNGYYSSDYEIGEELGQRDNKDIIGTDENEEFYKQIFISQIKDDNTISDTVYSKLEQDALLMRRLDRSIGYEKFKQTSIGIAQEYAVPVLYGIGGSLELAAAAGVEVVGCGTVLLCIPATALAIALTTEGTDNIATGFYNLGKDIEDQTSSYILTQVYNQSEEDARTIKLNLLALSVAGEIGLAVNASRAAAGPTGLMMASNKPGGSPELFLAVEKEGVIERLDNFYKNGSTLNKIKPPVDNLTPSNTSNLVTTIDNPRPHITVNPDAIVNGSVVLDQNGLFRNENGIPLNLTNTIIKDENGLHQVFRAPNGVEVIDLPKGSNLVGEVQYMESITPTSSSQNSGGVFSTIGNALGLIKNKSNVPSGWKANDDGTLLTANNSRVNRTEELYQVDGVTYEVFSNTLNGDKIISIPDGVKLKGSGSFINKNDVSPSVSQNTDAVDSLSDVKADVPSQSNRTPEGYEPDNDLFSNKPNIVGDITNKVGNYATSSTNTAKNTETYFRVEGGSAGNAVSQNRMTVNSDGTVSINSGCAGQLCISTHGSDHATYFLTEKRPGGNVLVFELDKDLHDFILKEAVAQNPAFRPAVYDPNSPQIVDPTKSQDSVALQLPKVWDSLIEENSSKARVLTQEEYLREFGK